MKCNLTSSGISRFFTYSWSLSHIGPFGSRRIKCSSVAGSGSSSSSDPLSVGWCPLVLSLVVSLILIVLSLAPLSDRFDVARTRRTFLDSFVLLLCVVVGVLTVGLSILNKKCVGVFDKEAKETLLCFRCWPGYLI